MPGTGLFQTIAEVAAAFVGFASIVIAVRSSERGELAAMDRLRLQIVLGTGLASLGFALVPLWTPSLGVYEGALLFLLALSGLSFFGLVALPATEPD